MDLFKNMLLENVEVAAERKIDRILSISPQGSGVVLIQINGKNALSRFCPEVELEEQFKAGESRWLKSDPFADLSCPEETIPESHRQRRDKAWSLILPIIQMPCADAFDSQKRGPVIEEIHRKTGVSKWVIYRNLRRYWQGGLRKNALLPKFKNCGAAGKDRCSSDSKRGRPRNLTKLKGAPPGVNVNDQTSHLFR